MRLKAVASFVFAFFALPGLTQAPNSSDSAVAQAEKAYTSKNWPEAESQYSSLVKQQSENARFWYRLGVSARANKHLDVALDAFEKAKELGSGKGLPASLADYEIATTYAAKGDNAKAIDALKASADAGFVQVARLENDSEWSSVRTSDQFIVLLNQVKHNASPCEDAEFKQFDFWLGDWDVASAADGVHRGSSHISKEMGGCVVWENWTSAGSPYFGKSYNTWNPNLKRWEQYWVDNTAGVMFFHGNRKDNVMDYWTDNVPQPDGSKLLRHLQFFNLGADKVRQFSQGSTDEGKTWHTEYDFIYTRINPQSAPSASSK
jgi:tetratricopeptide (TPR) repeat protein